ncbi:hypothetical protein J2Z49_000102 [Desulfofundulus luciae]|uniref:Histone n=1 Tax=Desulfofundulus luciae TaxID=74702 RepID=A0ABU0AWZ6_9FIRM|nr:hypothetical protein [Desulfofundulus luciae]MDQ0285012.1 hypothetical protein [Desulfofundulus luciae]
MNLREKLIKGIALISMAAFTAVAPLGTVAMAATAKQPVKPVVTATRRGAVPAKPANLKAGVKKAAPAVPAAKAKTKSNVKKKVATGKPVAGKKVVPKKPAVHKKGVAVKTPAVKKTGTKK